MVNVGEKDLEVSAERKAQLDPSFYEDIFAFRNAIANGNVDTSKACQNMNEFKWSLSHG